jgi:hypothetical protein
MFDEIANSGNSCRGYPHSLRLVACFPKGVQYHLSIPMDHGKMSICLCRFILSWWVTGRITLCRFGWSPLSGSYLALSVCAKNIVYTNAHLPSELSDIRPALSSGVSTFGLILQLVWRYIRSCKQVNYKCAFLIPTSPLSCKVWIVLNIFGMLSSIFAANGKTLL